MTRRGAGKKGQRFLRLDEDRIRKAFGYRGEIDEAFCERKLWWWRALDSTLPITMMDAPNWVPLDSEYSYLVPKGKRKWFSAEIFETLQRFHELGLMHALVKRWRDAEIRARLGLDSVWPAYRDSSKGGADQLPADATRHLAQFGPVELNLRKSPTALLREIKEQLGHFLKKHGQTTQRPNARIPSRLRYFEPESFEPLEIIDRHFLLGVKRGDAPEEIPDSEWSRVRGMLRLAGY